MRLLITNDDGIESPGIHRLARALHQDGHEVVVVAPDRDHSGVGASLGGVQLDGVEVRHIVLPGLPDVRSYSIAGPPGLAVVAAVLGGFGERPDVVVSGINAGPNTGRSILHSGTVGAALTAQNFGLSGLAVSVAEPRADGQWNWDGAARLAGDVLRDYVAEAPARTVLNLNVPASSNGHVPLLRWARLAPFGAVRATSADISTGRLVLDLTASEGDMPSRTDSMIIANGDAALTTLVGITEAWPSRHSAEASEPTPEIHILPGTPVERVHRTTEPPVLYRLYRPDTVDSATSA